MWYKAHVIPDNNIEKSIKNTNSIFISFGNTMYEKRRKFYFVFIAYRIYRNRDLEFMKTALHCNVIIRFFLLNHFSFILNSCNNVIWKTKNQFILENIFWLHLRFCWTRCFVLKVFLFNIHLTL